MYTLKQAKAFEDYIAVCEAVRRVCIANLTEFFGDDFAEEVKEFVADDEQEILIDFNEIEDPNKTITKPFSLNAIIDELKKSTASDEISNGDLLLAISIYDVSFDSKVENRKYNKMSTELLTALQTKLKSTSSPSPKIKKFIETYNLFSAVNTMYYQVFNALQQSNPEIQSIITPLSSSNETFKKFTLPNSSSAFDICMDSFSEASKSASDLLLKETRSPKIFHPKIAKQIRKINFENLRKVSVDHPRMSKVILPKGNSYNTIIKFTNKTTPLRKLIHNLNQLRDKLNIKLQEIGNKDGQEAILTSKISTLETTLGSLESSRHAKYSVRGTRQSEIEEQLKDMVTSTSTLAKHRTTSPIAKWWYEKFKVKTNTVKQIEKISKQAGFNLSPKK